MDPVNRLPWTKGTNLTVTVVVKEPDDSLTDITGGTFQLVARETLNGPDLITVAGSNNGGLAGSIDFLLTPATAPAFKLGSGFWDVVGLLNGNEFQPIPISEFVVSDKMADQ